MSADAPLALLQEELVKAYQEKRQAGGESE